MGTKHDEVIVFEQLNLYDGNINMVYLKARIMDQFERSAQPDFFGEESDITPIIIKYAAINEERHSKENITPFREAIKKYEGINTCVFVNEKRAKRGDRDWLLIILEGVGLSIRVQIDRLGFLFFSPTLLSEKTVIPNDEDEFIRRCCNIRFVDSQSSYDVIDVVTEMHWGNRLVELKEFILKVASLRRPLKEIRKEKDQAIWSSYVEGLEALTKDKQELRKISEVGEIREEKNRRKENVQVISLQIDATTNVDNLKKNIDEVLDRHNRWPYFMSNNKGKECVLVYGGFCTFTEDEIKEFESTAEQSCYRMKGSQPLHILKGAYTFKSSESDNEAIIAEFDSRLKDYDPNYPKKVDRRYSFGSDDDVSYAKKIIQQHFGNILKCTSDTNLVISFVEDRQGDLLQDILGIYPNAEVTEHEQDREQFVVLQTKQPIDCERIETMSLAFESCRVEFQVSKFDSSVEIENFKQEDGAYIRLINDKTRIKKLSSEWGSLILEEYKKKDIEAHRVISDYQYAFRKSVSKDVMKSIARHLVGVSNIRRITATGRAYCELPDFAVYEEIIGKVKSIAPNNVQLIYPEYVPTLTISFLNEDPEYKKEICAIIEGELRHPCKWSTDGDALMFAVEFSSEDDRDAIVGQMLKIASEYSHVFDLTFEDNNVKGITTITFNEDAELVAEYEKALQEDFGREEVRLVSSAYDKVKSDLLEAMSKDDREGISSLRKKEREILQKAEKIGTCTVRTRNTVKIELDQSFVDKLGTKEISIKKDDYVRFPLIGESTNIARQKDAMDRILKPGTKNRYGKVIPRATNPKLSDFLFDPRYASETLTDIEKTKEQIKERQIESNMNEKQREAVAKAIEAQDIALIQGPPGTGKTTVIAEIIWQKVLRNPSCKILLTSQTNTAVDNALERLQGKRGIRPIRIARSNGELIMGREGKRYLWSQIKEWEERPDESNCDNAVNIWVDTILNEMNHSDAYSQVIARWKEDLDQKDSFVRKTFAESYLRNVNLVAATCSICGSRMFGEMYVKIFGNSDMKFDVVIMDEASKATPLEMAIPMVLGKKIILIGDHKQLPPMVDDEEVKESLRKIDRRDLVDKLEEIKESQFKRLFEVSQKMRPSLVSTLDTQYRMHKQIMNCITHFYEDDIDGGLKCGIEDSMDSEDWTNRGSRYHGLENSPFINPNIHAIWVDVDGKEEKNGHSPYNRAELKAIEKILRHLRSSDGYKEYMSHCTRPEDEEIGIITFYGAQVKELQKMHKEGKFGLGKYKIDVVDSFQGMERNIVIVSTVRTERMGFAKATERINVAFSRAKRLLIVVGDKGFFMKDSNYRKSIQAMEVIDINQLS